MHNDNTRIPRSWLTMLLAALTLAAPIALAQVTSAEDVAARDAEREQIAALNAARDEAQRLHRQRKYRDALGPYSRALELDSAHAPTYYNLGLCQKNLGNADEALAACRRAIELDPGFGAPRLEIGNLLLRGNDLAGARQAFENIKAQMADSMDYVMAAESGLGKVATEHTNAAIRSMNQRQYDEAAGNAALAVEVGPDTFRPWHVTGMIEERRKNLDEAETAYQEAMARAGADKDRAAVLRGLGSVNILRARAARANQSRANRFRRAAVDFLQQSVAIDSSNHTSYI
jgi:Tfp pilus assembly protein PilF